MTTKAAEQLIAKLERFQTLNEEEKEFLRQSFGRLLRFARGQTIVADGDHPSASCLMVEGWAARVKSFIEGARQIVAIHMAGDFTDLHSFVLPIMDHSIEALTPCTIVQMSHDRLKQATERYPGLTRALWYDTAVDAAIQREWMASLGKRSAYEQLAHLICELYLRSSAVGLASKNELTLSITQQELGEVLGLSAVHVNRTLNALKRSNLILVEGHKFIIPDIGELKSAAGFDPRYLEGRAI